VSENAAIIIKARCVKPCTIQLNKRQEYEDGVWDTQIVSVDIAIGDEHTFEWYDGTGAFMVAIGELWGLVDFPVYYRHFEEIKAA
jgi:hypothetical protein